MAKDLMADAISGPTYQVLSNAGSHCKAQRFEIGCKRGTLDIRIVQVWAEITVNRNFFLTF